MSAKCQKQTSFVPVESQLESELICRAGKEVGRLLRQLNVAAISCVN